VDALVSDNGYIALECDKKISSTQPFATVNRKEIVSSDN